MPIITAATFRKMRKGLCGTGGAGDAFCMALSKRRLQVLATLLAGTYLSALQFNRHFCDVLTLMFGDAKLTLVGLA